MSHRLTSTVELVVDGRIGWIVIGEPESFFVLDRSAVEAVAEAVWKFDRSPSVRVIALRSANPDSFCVGGDLREVQDVAASGSASIRPGAYGALSCGEVLFAARTPTVAQVGGLTVGGGLELVLAADIVVCSDTAKLSAPESLRGTGGLVLAQLLGRLVPRRIAFELLYTGRVVDAAEALRLNLVNEVVATDELGAATSRWLSILASRAPLTMAAHRASMNYLLDQPLSAAMRTPVLPDPYSSGDMRRGIAAFFERKDPMWEGS